MRVMLGTLLMSMVSACGMSGSQADKAPAGLGEVCGTGAGIACAEDLWCDLEPGRCGQDDAPGRCIQVPEVCTKQYDPVCGCDGRTHGNDCERRTQRAQMDHEGECGARATVQVGSGGGA